MKIVYTSRTGNVQSMIERLGIADAIKIGEGADKVAEEYILFTDLRIKNLIGQYYHIGCRFSTLFLLFEE